MNDPKIITREERENRKFKGAGDAFAFIAQPVAKAIDAVAGTKLSKCGGCAKRRKFLNKLIPFTIARKFLPKDDIPID